MTYSIIHRIQIPINKVKKSLQSFTDGKKKFPKNFYKKESVYSVIIVIIANDNDELQMILL